MVLVSSVILIMNKLDVFIIHCLLERMMGVNIFSRKQNFLIAVVGAACKYLTIFTDSVTYSWFDFLQTSHHFRVYLKYIRSH